MKHTIKSAKREMEDLNLQYQNEEQKLNEIKTRMNTIQNKQIALQKVLDKLTAKLTVSEHAIIRYIERVIGISRDEITSKILTPEVEAMYKKLGAGKYPIADGKARAVIKNNTVVTVEE